MEDRTPPTSPLALLSRRPLALLVASALFLVNASRFVEFFQDDAYIYLRYASHVAQGLGPVFNVGERVEGFTSPLWLLGLSALLKIGLAAETAARVLGCAFSLATIGLLVASPRPGVRLVSYVVATCGGLAMWAMGGLDVTAATCTLLLALIALDRVRTRRDAALAGGAVFLAALARPEQGLLLPALAGAALLAGRRRPGRAMYAHAATSALTAAACLLALSVARRAWYGAWLPNTFAAKSGAADLVPSGLSYLYASLPWFAVPALALGATLVRRGEDVDEGSATPPAAPPAGLVVALYAALVLAHTVWSGGDHMRGARFLLPTMVACAWAVGASAWRWAAAATLAQVLVQVVATTSLPAEPEGAALYGRVVGTFARATWPRGSLIAVNTAGSVPWFSGLRAIDMLGLTDAVIARSPFDPRAASRISPWATTAGHRRGNGRYVLDRAPDYIIIGPSTGFVGPRHSRPMFVGDVQLFEDPRLRRCYEPRRVRLPIPRAWMGADATARQLYLDVGWWERRPDAAALCPRVAAASR